MSSIYSRQLKRGGDEFLAAQSSPKYAERSWNRHDLANDSEFRDVTPQAVREAAVSLEATFFIRLFATFEGILKEHLAHHHPGIAVPEDARAVWLIDRVAVLQSPPIGAPLRQRVHDVRKYRMIPAYLPLSEAQARLSVYLSKLPEPYS